MSQEKRESSLKAKLPEGLTIAGLQRAFRKSAADDQRLELPETGGHYK
jgi:hypothetical protein